MSYECSQCGVKLRKPPSGSLSAVPQETGVRHRGHTRAVCLMRQLRQAQEKLATAKRDSRIQALADAEDLVLSGMKQRDVVRELMRLGKVAKETP